MTGRKEGAAMGKSLPSLSMGPGPRAGITGYKTFLSKVFSLSLPGFASHIVLFCFMECVQHLVFALASMEMRFHPVRVLLYLFGEEQNSETLAVHHTLLVLLSSEWLWALLRVSISCVECCV